MKSQRNIGRFEVAKFDRGVISFALSLTLVLFRPAFAQAEETALTGLVVSIIDGDTIDLLVNRRQIRVRLADIDTPERGQPWYQKAKLALGRKVFGETVTALSSSQDRYGREIAQLMFDDRHINSEMVAEGMAWVYRKYSSNPLLLALEEKARLERLGLWSVDHQIPPWDWRRKPRSPVSGSPRVDVCG